MSFLCKNTFQIESAADMKKQTSFIRQKNKNFPLRTKTVSVDAQSTSNYMRKIYSSILIVGFLILSNNFANAQINADGVPFIKNYAPKSYQADEVNYCITRDYRGIVYIGNTENILEYDGHTWSKILVPNQKLILSLANGPDSSIYVGAVNDFGHLITDSHGKLVYESLGKLINDSIVISRVWKIYTDSTNVYFSTFEQIFVYNVLEEKIKIIEIPFEYNFFSFLLNNKLYTGNFEKGLLTCKNGKYQIANGGQFFAEKDIFSMLPWSKDTIIVSTYEGLTLYTPKSGEIIKFETINSNTNNAFIKTPIYSGIKIDDNHFGYATNGGGLFVINKKGEIITHLDKTSGIQNDKIISVFLPNDSSGVIWLSLELGITNVNLNSKVRRFTSQPGLEDKIYFINQFDNDFYFSTPTGVSKLIETKEKTPNFEPIEGISEITASLINFKTETGKTIQLAGTIKDIYQIKNGKAKPLNIGTETYSLLQSKTQPNQLYAATSRGIKRIRYINNRFKGDDGYLGLPKQHVNIMVEDKNGNVWSNTLSERQLINKDGELKELPENIKNKSGFFFKLKDDVFYSTDEQVFKLNYSNQNFEESSWLTKNYLKKEKSLKKVIALNDTIALVNFTINHKSISDLITFKNAEWSADTLSLRILPSMTIFTAYYNNDKVYIGSQEGLYIANLKRSKVYNNPFRTLIRAITIGTDSLYYKGGTNYFEEFEVGNSHVLKAPLAISYHLNNISFTYSASFYEKEEGLQYRSYLEGFDKQWSNWSKDISRTYTNLKEGDYRFQVEARNIYNSKSKIDSFVFSIDPPWYRSWWAILVYIVLVFLAVRVAISLYTRKLQEDKKRLERIVKERTAEILEKNKRIERQNVSITDSIRYAKRIQTAVLPDKQTSDLFEYFIYFKPKDIVSGDFYWIYHFEKDDRLIVVAADCTGHGVPGAFMSMLGTSFLNEIVAKLDVSHSEVVLNQLRENVIKTLNQGSKELGKEEQKDGMDMAIASIDLKTNTLEFSGANNPLVLIRDNELIEYKPDKMPIGAYVKQDIPFTRKEIQLQKDDIFYLFSDGYVDQFGGKQGRKYMKKRFKEFLLTIHKEPIEKQKQMLNEEMFNWMDGIEQIDDQIIIGMRLVK